MSRSISCTRGIRDLSWDTNTPSTPSTLDLLSRVKPHLDGRVETQTKEWELVWGVLLWRTLSVPGTPPTYVALPVPEVQPVSVRSPSFPPPLVLQTKSYNRYYSHKEDPTILDPGPGHEIGSRLLSDDNPQRGLISRKDVTQWGFPFREHSTKRSPRSGSSTHLYPLRLIDPRLPSLTGGSPM